jgi:hypothetical protein
MRAKMAFACFAGGQGATLAAHDLAFAFQRQQSQFDVGGRWPKSAAS